MHLEAHTFIDRLKVRALAVDADAILALILAAITLAIPEARSFAAQHEVLVGLLISAVFGPRAGARITSIVQAGKVAREAVAISPQVTAAATMTTGLPAPEGYTPPAYPVPATMFGAEPAGVMHARRDGSEDVS